MDNTNVIPKDILEWCFVVGALILGTFGFLYNTYTSAMFAYDDVPDIVNFLCTFCRVLVLSITMLTGLAIFTSYQNNAGIPVWIIVGCVTTVNLFSIILAFFKMRKI